MRNALQKAGLQDVVIDAIQDHCGGDIATLISEGDLHYKTTDICALITEVIPQNQMQQVGPARSCPTGSS